jgi:dTDP-4-dehydrorhamnose reductase
MKAVVFGAGGRLGKEIVEQLMAAPEKIHVCPVFHQEIDVRHSWSVRDYLEISNPTVVINCTAANGLEYCDSHSIKAIATNTFAPLTMAQWCKEHDVLFVHFSTDYASVNPNDESFEDGPGDAIGVYGASKRAGELLVLATWRRSLVLRISSLYGRDLAGSLSPLRDFKSLAPQSLKVITQTAVPISTRMVAKKAIEAMKSCYVRENSAMYGKSAHHGLFNITNHGPVTKKAFAEFAIRAVFGVATGDVIEANELPIPRPRYSVLAGHKFNRTFGLPTDFVYDDLNASLKAWGLLSCSTV